MLASWMLAAPAITAAAARVARNHVGFTAVPATISAMFDSTHAGEGTYSGEGPHGGKCKLEGDHTPHFVTSKSTPTAAISGNYYFGSQACGMCIQVSSTTTAADEHTSAHPQQPMLVNAGNDPVSEFNEGEPFVVMVDNSCSDEGCMATGAALDLALDLDGRWDLSWEAVECPVGNDVIDYFFEDSNRHGMKVQARGHRFPIAGWFAG